ncbi:transglutaminase [Flavobacterium capsici]|uniref:Transglutaminase n=1 Tax=Flavobacterium capsici TaxID=3075618 RepID=A0AA96J837_9FLAO|nr:MULTISPECIES: transglutaminase [unclassified Flavobacterium]WNM17924.1 transglutaminase [Flavobacterium sp. PMR2A8]WNM21976.1 transglutaminase [Flavobacterium sp. PMTSA4]
MIKLGNLNYQTLKERLRIKSPWDSIIIFLLSILFTIPVFIIAHQKLIDLEWPIHLDRILLFILITTAFHLILKAMRRITLISIIIYVLTLLYGTIFGGYGFVSVFDDYRSMIYAMTEDPNPQDLIVSKLLPFPNKYKIIKAVEYDNPRIRSYALRATTKNFRKVKGYNEYFTLIQCFAVFKEINSNWNYVSDPKGRDYIATASETLPYLSGDCDDHSIFMAACIKSIGGIPRLIHTKGHIYPEIYIGDKKSDLEAVNYLIKKELFSRESKGQSLHYHIDERGKIWLNLDYTADYPGGPFMNEEILGALTLD